jgi:hypothetical protein
MGGARKTPYQIRGQFYDKTLFEVLFFDKNFIFGTKRLIINGVCFDLNLGNVAVLAKL